MIKKIQDCTIKELNDVCDKNFNIEPASRGRGCDCALFLRDCLYPHCALDDFWALKHMNMEIVIKDKEAI